MLEDDPLVPAEGRVVHSLYLFLGLFVVVFSLLSLLIKERLYLSEALVATALGVALGPVGLDLFGAVAFANSDVGGATTHHILLEVTRVVLVIQCMAAGVSLPGDYVRREWVSLATLLGPVMICMWLVSALGLFLILRLLIVDALVIAACITPTDPILANSIVQGKFAERHIPVPVRQLLSAESAANDGLGLPFLLLPLFVSRYASVGGGIGAFIWKVLLYQVLLAVALGTLVGYAAQRALKYAERRNLVDKESMLSFSIALGIMVMGGMTLMGSDDVLASFVAGTVLTWDHWFNKQFAESHFQESIDLLLNLAYFVLFGLVIPWDSYDSAPGLEVWRLLLAAAWVLAFRRLPAVFLFRRWIPAIHSAREAVFAGWFGPIGGGAIFYSMMAIVYFEVPASPIFPITCFIVLCSIIVHGGTVSLFQLGISRHSTYRDWRNAGNGTRSAVRAAIVNTPAPARLIAEAAIIDQSSHTVCIPNEIPNEDEDRVKVNIEEDTPNEIPNQDEARAEHVEMKVKIADDNVAE
ncbi:Sodium/hydrogen exchanger family-domain-containing protein [Geranomyces variabilis]|nr:Sodium/hydrogen exchanger family-domain-containing protein [Geranomyces variabilis]KAJ3138971.1 hypothetical protein HDU90_000877 [Geranomyces variabilis]